jgi:hypothetical protein
VVSAVAALLTFTVLPAIPAAQAEVANPAAGSAGCSRALTTADFIRDKETGMAEVDGVWGARASTRITIRRAVVMEPDCTYTFSLASYETDGPTWRTSGTQRFIDHASITLTSANRTGVLEVTAPRCFGQVDLYHGSVIYDGGAGPVPRYPDVKIPGLIAGFDGGYACPATPSTDLEIAPCSGSPTATVRLALSERSGSRTFTVWSSTPGSVFTQVGGPISLPAGAIRESAVVVPLVEDVPVTIQVKVGDEVLRTFEPVTANCVPDRTDDPTGKVPSYGMFLIDADPDGAGPLPAVRYGVQVEPTGGTQARVVPLSTKGNGKSPAAIMRSLGYTWTSPTAAWLSSRFTAAAGVDRTETDLSSGGQYAAWASFRPAGGSETLKVVEVVTHDGVYKPDNFAVAGEAAKVKTAGGTTSVYFYAPAGR